MTENLEEIQFELLEFVIVKISHLSLVQYTPFKKCVVVFIL